ncbi:MAG TPA: hypothetical protein PLR96_14540, partial [Flavobacteriales bacterium]|nr:hypothetical protein [Flavobacteriales bacterium]
VILPSSPESTRRSLVVRNALGQEVHRVRVLGPTMALDLTSEPNGVYTFQLEGEGPGMLPARLVIQH